MIQQKILKGVEYGSMLTNSVLCPELQQMGVQRNMYQPGYEPDTDILLDSAFDIRYGHTYVYIRNLILYCSNHKIIIILML